MMNDRTNTQETKAFLHFAYHVLSGQEGAFFIFDRPEIEKPSTWALGYGRKKYIEFDAPLFPKFCVSNFLGDINHAYVFEKTVTSFDKTFKPQESLSFVLERFEKADKLILSYDLSHYASETEQSFVKKVKNIQQFEFDGNAWVVNMTQNIVGDLGEKGKVKAKEDKILLLLSSFYKFLKSGSSVCGGVVITDEQLFCSFSPEVFLKQDGDVISTFPIKGTGRREDLENSEKEVSELHMITDLLRNDFGQICESVEVKRERYLTKEKDFYHAQSEVRGVLKKYRRSSNILTWAHFQRLLPAGSVSGAPKKKVVEKILELENFDRRFYTGTYGVQFSPEKSIYNVLIRTLFLGKKHWYFPVGAGITVESDPELEFAETFDKAKVFERFCVV